MGLAVALLVVLAMRQYGWWFVPPELAGVASKGLGSVAALMLVYLVWLLAQRSKLLTWVALLYAWFEAQTVICTAVYMYAPWPILPGQAMCSAKMGFNLGAIGLLAIAVLAHLSIRQSYRAKNVANL